MVDVLLELVAKLVTVDQHMSLEGLSAVEAALFDGQLSGDALQTVEFGAVRADVGLPNRPFTDRTGEDRQ